MVILGFKRGNGSWSAFVVGTRGTTTRLANALVMGQNPFAVCRQPFFLLLFTDSLDNTALIGFATGRFMGGVAGISKPINHG